MLDINKFMNFCLLLYLCAISAHKLGEGFDGIFLRATFVLYISSVALSVLIEKKRLVLNNYILWLFLFFGFCYMSFIWARNQDDMMIYSNTFIQVFGVAIGLIQQIKDIEDIDRILKLVHLSLVYTAILLVIKTPSEEFGTERIGDVLGLHCNSIGFRFATATLLCIYFFTKVNKNKWFYMLTAIGFSVLVLLTGSRKSIIMILVCVFVYVVFYKSKEQDRTAIIKKMILVGAIIILLVVLWYAMMNVDVFYNVIGIRIEAMFDAFFGEDVDGSINERAFYSEKAMELFGQHPVIGYGCNNFKQYMREIGYSHVAYSHNNFTELLSTLGIIGTSIYYVPLILFTWQLLKSYFFNTKNTLALVLLIFMIYTHVTTSYVVYYQTEFYYIFFILIFMYNKFSKSSDEGKQLVDS